MKQFLTRCIKEPVKCLWCNISRKYFLQKQLLTVITFAKSFTTGISQGLNPLKANPTNWSNTLKQFVGKLPTNCLSTFGHFVGLVLKGGNQTEPIIAWCSPFSYRRFSNVFRDYKNIMCIGVSTLLFLAKSPLPLNLQSKSPF